VHFVVFFVEPSADAEREIVSRVPAFRAYSGYRGLLTILFRSVELFHPAARTVVLTDERTPLASLPVNATVVRCPVDRDRIMHSRLLAQIDYLRHQAGNSAVVFLDPDIIVNADLTPLLAEDFDIALTYRDLPQMPINDGVIVLNAGRRRGGLRFLERVRSIYDRHCADDPYWFGSQRAYIAALGKKFAHRRSDIIDVRRSRVRLLPCEQWNFSPGHEEQAMAADLRDKYVLHFKGERKWMMPLYWQKHVRGISSRLAPGKPARVALVPATDTPSLRRLTLGLALVAGIAWCLLLFGIGLDDLTDGTTEPGVAFELVVLTIVIVGLGYWLWRTLSPPVRRRI
jgi:hypothetical protein